MISVERFPKIAAEFATYQAFLTRNKTAASNPIPLSPWAVWSWAATANFMARRKGGGANQNHGTVFSLTPAGALPTLYTFAGGEGSHPAASLAVGPDGNLHGTAEQGGTYGDGAVFSITPTGALTSLHSFINSDGSTPYRGLVEGTDGNFYGTTESGGTNGVGTVFSITPAGVLTTLHNFTAATDGSYPLRWHPR